MHRYDFWDVVATQLAMTPSKVRVGGVFCVVLTSFSGNSLSFSFSFIDSLSPCAVE